jgi:thiol-disulfide isomerase/thioredoxin
MPSNNKSNNSKSSNSVMKSKPNWALILGLGILVVIIAAIYYMKKSNEGFASSCGGNSAKKMSNNFIGDTNIASKLNPAKGECVVALFYADWCPHCQHFKPHYQRAMSDLNGKPGKDGKKMRLEMVDCDANKDISRQYDVSGYPTVKILKDDGTQVEYGGERTYEGLRKYLVSDN